MQAPLNTNTHQDIVIFFVFNIDRKDPYFLYVHHAKYGRLANSAFFGNLRQNSKESVFIF